MVPHTHAAVSPSSCAGKQCRERWHNQLRPEIKRDPWTGDEEDILIEAHRRLGNKCARA